MAGEHLDTTTGTPDLSGSGPCDISLCRINPAFRLASLSLWVVLSRCIPQLSSLLKRLAFGRNDREQFVPGLNKGLGAFVLELSGENLNLDPACANWPSIASQSPPSAATIEPSSARAFKVASGMVLTVNGAASALTLGALGFLAPVLAQRSLCGRAPAL